MRKLPLAVLAAVVLVTWPGAALGAPPDEGPPTPDDGRTTNWIVRLAEPPVATYAGGIGGFARTAREGGNRRAASEADERSYAGHLVRRHDEVLAAVGGAKLYDYTYSLNGFAARLTTAQADALRRTPGVVGVEPDGRHQLATDSSPHYLGVSRRDGLWERLGGPGAAGEDVVVGVLDTGVWPEHPSFSDQSDLRDRPGDAGDARRVYDEPRHWYGTCAPGEGWRPSDCNHKLVGARWFVNGFGPENLVPGDYRSARDEDGHGTHTASTAAGNGGVPASIFGAARGPVSGIAPRARLAAYKVCWDGRGADFCLGTDMIAAIDAAVADGVDVLNISIVDPRPLVASFELALLTATDAGVFVAQSAGNDGPGAATIGSSSVPWVTSVAAGTQKRTFRSPLTLGHGAGPFSGESLTAGLGRRRLVDGAAAAADGAAPADAERCHAGALDAAAVEDAVVLCLRDGSPRLEKGKVLAEVGAAGMVLYNAEDAAATLADNHFVPTVHVDHDDGLAVKAYAAEHPDDAVARIGPSAETPAQGSVVAAFSSRGPNRVAPDVLKPDVLAPGVNIVAASSPVSPFVAPGERFRVNHGTSMSSPHVAGAAALLVQDHPQWSPAAVKSALLTTARRNVVKEDGTTPADPFDHGSGYVRPNLAADPGLVYDAGLGEYLAFLCGNGDLTPADCAGRHVEPVAPTDLNQPNIAVGELVGRRTVRRTVTNVGRADATYTSSVTGLAGLDVAVEPSVLDVPAGGSASFTVTITVADAAAVGAPAFGSLDWSDGSHLVRSAVAVLPTALEAPGEVTVTGAAGTSLWSVIPGANGPFSAAARGLVPAATEEGEVATDEGGDVVAAVAGGVGAVVHPLTVPAGSGHVRLALSEEATTVPGQDDLDLFLFRSLDTTLSEDELVASSEELGADEQVDLASPPTGAGSYYAVVHGFATAEATSTYELSTWVVGGAEAGNLDVTAPSSVTVAEPVDVAVAWSGLDDGTRYLGAVTYHDVTPAPPGFGDDRLGSTLVAVDT
jgi:subtilisin family serine protease